MPPVELPVVPPLAPMEPLVVPTVVVPLEPVVLRPPLLEPPLVAVVVLLAPVEAPVEPWLPLEPWGAPVVPPLKVLAEPEELPVSPPLEPLTATPETAQPQPRGSKRAASGPNRIFTAQVYARGPNEGTLGAPLNGRATPC